jgi:exopolysaccharide biosynthesis polyprenyl glycosylphosphotransferase
MSAARQGTAEQEMSGQTPAQSLPDLARTRSSDVVPVSLHEPVPTSAVTSSRLFAASLILADASALVTTLLLVHARVPGGIRLTPDLTLVMLLAPLVWIGTFGSFGLYRLRTLSAPEEFRRVVSATTLAVLVVAVASVWWEDSLDRSSLAVTWVIALSLELAVRWLARWHIRREKRLGRLTLRTLIVGTNHQALALAKNLSTPGAGFAPIGFLRADDGHSGNLGLPVLGSIDDLMETIRSLSIECVIIASSEVSASDMNRISRACRQANAEIRVSVNSLDMLISRLSVERVDDITMVSVRPVRMTGFQDSLKRIFDLAVASIALIVCMPIMVLIALTLMLTSREPVVFRQERITKGGRPFTMYKFRTMTAADPEHLSEQLVIDLTIPFFKMANDPRLTWIGRLLRSFSLDELPQLWNVVRGDMSLVGPRPLPAEQVAANLDQLVARHEVRAGLTGWWQINGRSELDAEEALKLDLFYIENWSLSLDVYVLLKTIGVVLFRRGAY